VLMVKHGMTPLQVLRSATASAADLLGLGATLGRIAPGYVADLLAVTGNPAERIEALDDVRTVFVNGRAIRHGD
jgi:imidazolonepropionase-like amidohydrolase